MSSVMTESEESENVSQRRAGKVLTDAGNMLAFPVIGTRYITSK